MTARSGWRDGCCFGAGIALGAVLFVLGIVLNLLVLPRIVRDSIKQELVMRADGSEREQDFFILKQVWIYNVTNPDDVWKFGHPPKFREVGPFAYRTRMRHKNVTYLEEGRKVRMMTDRIFYYSREHSCPICTNDIRLTVPNMLLFKIYGLIREMPEFVQRQAARLFLHLRAMPFVTVPVAGLLFDGYDEILITMLREPFMRSLIPQVPDKIGYFSGINATNAGFFTYDTGLGNIADVGRILSWNNRSTTPLYFWDTPQARAINGSAGGRFKPFLEETDQLYVFLSDICRSVYFTYEKRVKVDGLEALQYGIPPEAFNWTLPENQGFCKKDSLRLFPEQTDSCLPSGLMDLSRCKLGAPPSAASMPHFLYTPNYVQKAYPQLPPAHPDLDRSYVVLEQTTGVPIYLSLKFQINILTFHDPNFKVLRKLNQTIFPVLWINQTASMDEGTKNLIYEKIYLTQSLATKGLWITAAVGFALLLLSLSCWIVIGTKKANAQKYPAPVKV